jgi:hypothetical protein
LVAAFSNSASNNANNIACNNIMLAEQAAEFKVASEFHSFERSHE